jgi:hypothetical protein
LAKLSTNNTKQIEREETMIVRVPPAGKTWEVKSIEAALEKMVTEYGATDCDGSKYMQWPQDDDRPVNRWDALVELHEKQLRRGQP